MPPAELIEHTDFYIGNEMLFFLLLLLMRRHRGNIYQWLVSILVVLKNSGVSSEEVIVDLEDAVG